MITFTRVAEIAPGKFREAMEFAAAVSKHVGEKHAMKLAVSLPFGGNPNRIQWASQYATMAELDAVASKLAADVDYMALIAGSANVFIAGSVFDEIWRSAGS